MTLSEFTTSIYTEIEVIQKVATQHRIYSQSPNDDFECTRMIYGKTFTIKIMYSIQQGWSVIWENHYDCKYYILFANSYMASKRALERIIIKTIKTI